MLFSIVLFLRDLMVGLFLSYAGGRNNHSLCQMIKSKGENRFKDNTFDKYEWSANTYQTPEEIYTFCDNHDIWSKKIKSIRAIGAMIEPSLGNWKDIAGSKLESCGIIDQYNSYDDCVIFPDGTEKPVEECSELFGNVKTHLNFYLYEPIIMSFEDGTSLELLPDAPFGLRMSFCAIPNEIKDGTNHAEYDIERYLGKIVSGRNIHAVKTMIESSVVEKYNCKTEPHLRTERQNNIYSICLNDSRIELSHCRNNGFSVSFSSILSNIRCSEINITSELEFLQVPIGVGKGYGGAITVSAEKGKRTRAANYESIHIGYSFPLLANKIMKKYYEKDKLLFKQEEIKISELYGVYKYTISSIKQAMTELLAMALAAENNPFDKSCEELFPTVREGRATDKQSYYKSKRVDILQEIDYAKRFAKRIIQLAEHADADEFIVFREP